MHRRTVLAAVASSSAALAGCLADGSRSGGSENESGDGSDPTDDGTTVESGSDCDRESLEVSDVLGTYEIAVETDHGVAETFGSRLGEYFQFDLSVREDDVMLLESTTDVETYQWN